LSYLNTRLALDVLPAGELAARKWDEHGRVLAVAAISVAELLDQIALFPTGCRSECSGDHHREQQMTGHRRRSPDHEQDAERDRLPLPVQNVKLATAHRCATEGGTIRIHSA
jgi:hypothetical protein